MNDARSVELAPAQLWTQLPGAADGRKAARANVLGVGISAVNMRTAVALAHDAVQTRQRGYVCVTGVHGVMESQTDPDFLRIQNASFLTVPDGMPTVWVGKLRGHHSMGRVYGPDFMLEICKLSQGAGFSHFLFGGKPGVAEQLKSALCDRFPGLKVVGTYTPPFRALNQQEESELIDVVARTRPDFFWVGLSTPKQERFMAQYADKLAATLLVGVGAAFDLHTGKIKDSPVWMKNMGLQWFHRLLQEPRRLWRRYLINNPKFVCYIAAEFLGLRSYPSNAEQVSPEVR